jgi:hypothetical protein
MIKLLLILTLNINTCDSTANYKQDTITVQDMRLAAQLKSLWIKYPLPNVKTPVIIYKSKENAK